jgi:rSAM/selenodomain-associated transferase 2
MLISVIIPVLNEESAIGPLLKNLVALEGTKEVIVVDGGSTDRTAQLAAPFAKLIDSPRGRALQMNAGAEAAKGDVLLFLHADTHLPPDALGAIERCVHDDSMVGGRFRVRLDNPGWRYRMVGWNINMRDRLVGGFTGDQAIFVRRDVFRDLGDYPPLALMEDLEFARRMRRKGQVARLPLYVTTSARRWERGGVLRTVFLMGMLRTLYYLHFPPSILQRWYNDAR